MTEIIMQIEDIEETFTFGLQEQIDEVGLIEMGTGHFISCCIKDIGLGDPAEYIAGRLASYNDVGLSKCGLTRAQYEAVEK